MTFADLISIHNKQIEKKEKSFIEIEYEFFRQKRKIKVPSYTKEKYLNPFRLVDKIILDLKSLKIENYYMAIENILIYDKNDKILRVAKPWVQEKHSQYIADDTRNYHTVHKDINAKIDLKAGPFKVYFPQRLENEKYEGIYTASEEFNKLMIKDRNVLNDCCHHMSLHLCIKQYRVRALQSVDFFDQCDQEYQPSKMLIDLEKEIE